MPPGTPQNLSSELDKSPNWSALHLWRDGEKIDAVCDRARETARLMESLPFAHIPGRAAARQANAELAVPCRFSLSIATLKPHKCRARNPARVEGNMHKALKGLVIAVAVAAAAQLAAEPTAKPKKGDPDEVVCEKITAIGSRVATKRVCATRAEWAEKRKLDKEATEQAQRMGNAPCQTTGSFSGSGTGRPSC
jgi:hypothetical protein